MSAPDDPSRVAVDAIRQARDRLVEFVERCDDDQWRSSPMEDDDRPTCVVVDHVAHAYDYIGGWLGALIDGNEVEVTPEIVDGLNAEHAKSSGVPTPAEVIGRLLSSGNALIALVGRMGPDEMRIGDGRVARLAGVAARHADGHRNELEVALGLGDPATHGHGSGS
jgi:hypothetical protein